MKLLCAVSVIFLVGCTATLPPKMEISKSYSFLGVKSYSIQLKNDGANIDPSFNKPFVDNYCQMLEGNIKLALQKINPEFQYIGTNADLSIDVTLEELQGGSAAARLWIGLGAGRSVSTVYVRVYRGKDSISESRITETTTMTNIVTDNYSNEDAVTQDVPLLARRIALFVNEPEKYKMDNQINSSRPRGY